MGEIQGGKYVSTYTGDQIDALLGNVMTANTNGGITALSNLAPIETGTTASRAYAIGDYFCLNGEMCRAIANISVGETLTFLTNYNKTTIRSALYQQNVIIGISAGQTLTITSPVQYSFVAALIAFNGQQSGLNGLYYYWAYSNGDVKSMVPIVEATGLTITAVSGGYAITNSSSNRGTYASISVLHNRSATLSWSVS